MKYLYWIVVTIFVGGVVYLTTLVNPQPTTADIISFANYETPEEFGKKIYATLQSELKNAPVVVLGVTPGAVEDLELWQGFLEAAQSSENKFEVIAAEPGLPHIESLNPNLKINVRDQMPLFVDGVRKAAAEKMRVVLIVPNIYSTQLLRGNPVDRLINEFQLPVLSLTVTKYPMTKGQEEVFEPLCVLEGASDHAGTGTLGCMIRKVARKTQGHKLENNKASGLVEKVNLHDYLILFNRNAGSR